MVGLGGRITMMTMGALVLALVLLATPGAVGARDRWNLADIDVLTLYPGRMTAARRGSAIPQVKCVGGNACHDRAATNMGPIQCTNRGYDGRDYAWECKADLPHEVRFGETTVSCEGYTSPSDEFVLADSCGVEYELWYTGDHGSRYHHDHNGHYDYNTRRSGTFENLIFFAVIAFFAYVLYTCFFSAPRGPTFYQPTESVPGASYYGTNGSGGGNGFWWGLLGGGLLGNLFSRPYGGGYGGYNAGYGRPWWGGWGNNTGGYYNSWGRPAGGYSMGSSSGGYRSGGSSGGSRTASGFGGTRRR